MIGKTFLREDPTVFIACKHTSDSAVRGAASIIKWFQKYKPKAQLLAAPKLQSRFPSSLFKAAHSNVSFLKEESEEELKEANLIVSCGGDGSLLHISSIFQNGPCPPVLPFSLGSLGFLSSFDFPDHKLVLNRLFKDKFTLLQRHRLQVESEAIPNEKRIVLNEILLNRSTVNVPEFEFSMNDDNFFFPSAIADAMILATATGSTGHSLSAGGPILHPTLNCGVLNFLAPRTLSGRPLVLPIDSECALKMGLSLESRAEEVDIHLDGIFVGNLKKGQLVKISRAQHPFSVFSFFGSTADWNNRLSRCLKWNQPYENTSHRIK